MHNNKIYVIGGFIYEINVALIINYEKDYKISVTLLRIIAMVGCGFSEFASRRKTRTT